MCAGLTLTAEGRCSDDVVVGTRAGDCLSLVAAHASFEVCTQYSLCAGLALTGEGQCSDHVVMGIRAGDCLFLDAAHAACQGRHDVVGSHTRQFVCRFDFDC